ncbi:hypothetical protein [Chitinasiproducens palmae]|uniref:Uncharacterized protein n=1 Tax=Chitinasiproducens palmae TaxID=1770053 RepID=A0A1H2PQZ7_9BURK|nr:hypothetical protein [Chitinasiproducens palmae]SDV49247.1 hypothetical protein SAMN05216551_107182 [Chitinasiproducens palmae]
MSRSGYSDDCDDWALIRWRGAVASAIRGERGQAFLRELLAALDAMPERCLIANDLRDADGDFCTLGVIGNARGVDIASIDPEDRDSVAAAFRISPALAAEIMFENDEGYYHNERPEHRWQRMRQWVASQIRGSGQS